jgi:hypothetical protein
MDSQPTIDVDASGSTFYHADRDLVNQRIELHQQIDIHIHPSPISTHSVTLSGPLPSTGVHFWGQFHRPNLLVYICKYSAK